MKDKSCFGALANVVFFLLPLIISAIIPVLAQDLGGIPDDVYRSMAPSVDISLGKHVWVNSDKLKVSVSFRGGGSIPEPELGLFEQISQDPNYPEELKKVYEERKRIYTLMPVVRGIALLWDGEVVASKKNETGEAFGNMTFEIDIKEKPEGKYTLQTIADWDGKQAGIVSDDYPFGQSRKVIVRIDRTAPHRIEPSDLQVVGSYVDDKGVIQTTGRDLKIYFRVDEDVRSVVTKPLPFCIVSKKLQRGELEIGLQGIQMGKTMLTVSLIDQAGNETEMKFTIKRKR